MTPLLKSPDIFCHEDYAGGMHAIRSATEKGTVSILFVEAVLDSLREKGVDGRPVLERSGISPALLSLPEARVTAAHYTALLRETAKVLDDEFFGQDSRRMKIGSFSMLCHSVVHCRRLDQAVRRTLDFFNLLLDDLHGALEVSDTAVRLVVTERHPERPARILGQEALLMFTHKLACWLVNRRIPIREAAFRFPEPAQGREYALMFCPALRFGQPKTVLTFDPGMFLLPVVRGEGGLKEFLRQAPENLLVQYKDSQSQAARIQRRLRPLPPADWPSLEVMAGELNCSLSTLRRRLEAEGQSYQLIKDRLRRDMAINLLADPERSITGIALELGFAEPSAFHRAFKKWTGARPGEYRPVLFSGVVGGAGR
ncbi:HTH-type transcriptional regulator VirS [mine drainage metagenome]|uniref:HTH-type transcriptional regulator VirS n=1 Tax=mine drainage metagenome TaxID=410659 RepID=A0A1J5QU59_9ZZZZ